MSVYQHFFWCTTSMPTGNEVQMHVSEILEMMYERPCGYADSNWYLEKAATALNY